jgi:hypothetical protein
LTIEEAKARPVTLGIVLMLLTSVLAATAFVWSEVRALSTKMDQVDRQQGETVAALNEKLGRLDERLVNLKETILRLDKGSGPERPRGKK